MKSTLRWAITDGKGTIHRAPDDHPDYFDSRGTAEQTIDALLDAKHYKVQRVKVLA